MTGGWPTVQEDIVVSVVCDWSAGPKHPWSVIGRLVNEGTRLGVG